MKYLINNCKNPYFNMAFDEFCLENPQIADELFYLWQNEPSVIIGANQNAYKEVNLKYLEEKGIHLVRRMTGGGAVYHDQGNINFSFVGENIPTENMFEKYISYIVQALKKLGMQDVEMSGRNDILYKGMKISGCAKRIYKNRCMVHGTLLYDLDTSILQKVLDGPQSKIRLRGTSSQPKPVCNIKTCLNMALEELENKLIEIICDKDKNFITISPEDIEKIEEIGKTKYNNQEWIYGKTHNSNISYSHKFPCGCINVELLVAQNKILDIQFYGDFIGNKNTNQLENALKNSNYHYQEILEKIQDENASLYFDHLSNEDLCDLIFGVHLSSI